MTIEILIALIVTLIALVLINKRYVNDDQDELIERDCTCNEEGE